MDDPLLFQATIHYAALHFALLRGMQEHAKIIAITTQTFRMINTKLQNMGSSLDESTIGATAVLTAAEVRPETP